MFLFLIGFSVILAQDTGSPSAGPAGPWSALAKKRFPGYQSAMIAVEDELWEFSTDPAGEDGIPVRLHRGGGIETFCLGFGGMRHVIAIVAATNGRHLGLGIVTASNDASEIEYRMAIGFRNKAPESRAFWSHTAALMEEPASLSKDMLLSIASIEGDTLVFTVQQYNRADSSVEIETHRFVNQCSGVGSSEQFRRTCMYHKDIQHIPHDSRVPAEKAASDP